MEPKVIQQPDPQLNVESELHEKRDFSHQKKIFFDRLMVGDLTCAKELVGKLATSSPSGGCNSSKRFVCEIFGLLSLSLLSAFYRLNWG